MEIKVKGSGNYAKTLNTDHKELELPTGQYEIKVKHPYSVQNLKKTVNITPEKSSYELDFKLQLKPDYIEYQAELFSQRVKMISSMAVVLVFLYYFSTEYAAAESAYADKQKEEEKAASAIYYQEVLEYNENAQTKAEEIKKHQDQAQIAGLLSAVSFGISLWYLKKTPELPDKLS